MREQPENRPSDADPALRAQTRDFTTPAHVLAAGGVLCLVCVAYWARGMWGIVLARLLLDGQLVLWWLVAAAGIGGMLLRLSRIAICSYALRLAVATAGGLGVMSLLILGLGLAGWLNRILSISLIALGVALFVLWIAWSGRRESHSDDRPNIRTSATRFRIFQPLQIRITSWAWLWLAAMPALAIALTCALLPPGLLWGDEPHGYDVVEYHLQVPREWYESGQVTPLHHNVFSFFPFNVEVHYLLAMHVRGGPWAGMHLAQLMTVAFAGLVVMAVYGILAETGSEYATLGGVAAASAPWMLLLAPIAYNESGLMLFATLAIGLMLIAIQSATPIRLAALAGAMAGFACGAKLTAVPMVLTAVPVASAVIAGPRPRLLVCAAVFLLAGIVTFSPWLIRNVAWSGNPVFPEAMKFLGQGHFSETQVQRWERAHAPREDQRSIGARAAAAWNQVFGDWRYGYILLPAGIAVGAVAFGRRNALLLALLVMNFIIWLAFTHLQGRFLVLLIPIASLLIGSIRGPRVGAPLMAAFVISVALLGIVRVNGVLDALGSRLQMHVMHLVGIEDLDIFTPLHEQTILPDENVVLVGDARAFLYDLPTQRLHYRTVFDLVAQPEQDVVQAWLNGVVIEPGRTLLVIHPSELTRLSATYWQIPPPPQDLVGRTEPVVIRK